MKTKQLKAHLLMFLTTFSLIFAAATANAAPGDLDTTFGGTGKMRVGVGGGFDNGNAVARQSDGKLVVAGSSTDINGLNFSLARYNTNGTLDATFGAGGKVVTFIDESCDVFHFAQCGAQAVAIFPDGKIVAVGSDGLHFALVKYNPNGTLDTSFGSGGIVISSITGSTSDNAVAVQIQGSKLIVAGYAYQSTGAFGLGYTVGIIARYNANGTLDTTFGNDGSNDGILLIYNGVTNRSFSILTLGLPGDGTIIAAGSKQTASSRYEGAMIRLTANGIFDGTFGSDGFVVNSNGQGIEAIYSLAFVSTNVGEDKIIASGRTATSGQIGSDVMLWSYNRGNGSPDSTFGTAGRTITHVGSAGSNAETVGNSVKIQFTSGGVANKIVVGGESDSDSYFAVRYSLYGDLDTAFGGGDGIATANSLGRCHSMLIQPIDNKIVLVGTANNADYGIARFTSGGSLDTTFDGDGMRIDDISDAAPRFIKATAIQSDGKILAAGGGVVARFNMDGSFDASFGRDGKVKSPVSVNAMALQSDGKIVITGGGIARLNTDGSTDTTFTGFFSSTDYISAVAIQPNGAIIVAGNLTTGSGSGANINFYVGRFLPNGSRDTDFGLNGTVTTDFNTGTDKAYAVAIQTDGKIVAAGEANGLFGLARYNSSDGSLDTSFSNDGKQTSSLGAGSNSGNAIAIRDGKIILAGYASNGSNTDFGAARYNISDGSLDTTFDGDGKLTTPIGTLKDVGNAIAIQPDGKILIAGSTETAANVNDFAVVRYNADGSLDNLFAAGGKKTIDFSGGNDLGNAIALDSSDRIIIAGQADNLFGIVRLLGDAPLSQTYEGDVQNRPNGDGFVDSDDIQQIRRFSIGNNLPYQSNEFQRADCAPRSTSGDGFVDGDDVQQARRFSVGTDGNQIAGGPVSLAPPVELDLLNEITELPFGKKLIRTKDGVQAAPSAFRIDAQNTSAGSTLTVPIRVDTVGNEAGYTFSIAFDSTVLTNPQVVIGDSGGDVLFNANNPGQIGFSVTTFTGGTIAAGNNKTLVTVTFTVAAGAPAGTTPITFTDTPARRKASPVDPNFPITQPTYTGGTITIGGATAAGTTLSGRIITAGGRGLSNATVILTDASGSQRMTRTGTFGYYRFEDVEAGQTYIVGVQSKRYKYASQTVSVTDEFNELNFYAVP